MNNGRGRIVLQDLLRLLHNLPWGEEFREASHAIDKLFVPAEERSKVGFPQLQLLADRTLPAPVLENFTAFYQA